MEIIQKLAGTVDRLIRPATFPLAVSILEEGELPDKVRLPLKHFGTRMCLCQGFSVARRFGFTMGFRPEDHECPIALIAFGLKERSKLLEEGAMAYPLYAATPEIGVRLNQTPCLSYSPGRKFLISPLDRASNTPDVVLVFGNSAQINRLVLAVAYMTGESVEGSFLGRGSCIQSIIKTVQTRNCQVVIPGTGDRALALAADDELIFAIPRERFSEIIDGLEGSQKAGGFRFPTLFPALLRQPPFHPSFEDVLKEMGLK